MIKELISTITIPFDDWTKYNLAYLGYIITGIEKKEYDNLVSARIKYHDDKKKSWEQKRVATGQSIKPDSLGMGISFDVIDEKTLRSVLFLIDNNKPDILAHIPENEYQVLQSLTALKELTENTDIKINPKVFKLTSKYDFKWASIMLRSHAISTFNIENSTSQLVRIRSCNDDHVCDYCKTFHNMVLPVDQVPQMPFSKCTCKYGCRCYTQPVSKRP